MEANIFEIVKYITHPIALIAYIAALITYYFIVKNVNDRKKLESHAATYRQQSLQRAYLYDNKTNL